MVSLINGRLDLRTGKNLYGTAIYGGSVIYQ